MSIFSSLLHPCSFLSSLVFVNQIILHVHDFRGFYQSFIANKLCPPYYIYYTCMSLEISINFLPQMNCVNPLLYVYGFRGLNQSFVANELCLIASSCLVLYIESAFLGSFLVSEERSILTYIGLFGNVVKHCLECLINVYLLYRN